MQSVQGCRILQPAQLKININENSLYSDKVVVITGSTQGLGEAIARKMVAEQAAGVSISGRNVERGKALAEELTGLGTPIIFVRTELENPDECRNLIRQSVLRFDELNSDIHPDFPVLYAQKLSVFQVR